MGVVEIFIGVLIGLGLMHVGRLWGRATASDAEVQDAIDRAVEHDIANRHRDRHIKRGS